MMSYAQFYAQDHQAAHSLLLMSKKWPKAILYSISVKKWLKKWRIPFM